jgi:hypothetical protein
MNELIIDVQKKCVNFDPSAYDCFCLRCKCENFKPKKKSVSKKDIGGRR